MTGEFRLFSPPCFACISVGIQWFLNCPDYFLLFILQTPTGMSSQSLSSLHRCTVSVLLLNYWRERKAAAYNRDETAAFIVVLKETFTWSLTSTPMFSKTISHIVFPPRKHASWAIICDPYLYHLSCTVSHFSVVWAACVPLLKGMPKPIFWGRQTFHIAAYTCYPSYSFKRPRSLWLDSQNASDSTVLG